MSCVPHSPAAHLATPQGFRAWLQSLPAASEVGQPCHPCRCPLARFLVSTGSCRAAEVYPGLSRAWSVHDPFALPQEFAGGEWSADFIVRLDNRFGDAAAVTAASALAVLDAVLAAVARGGYDA